MKKFLKSRGDYAESNNHSPSQGADQSPSTSASPEPLTTKEEQRELLEKAKSVQPPLPPVPPPVSPVNFNLPQKQEIETNDYESHGSTEESVQEQAPQFEPKPQNKTNTVSEPRPTMCRDFVRGTCSRGATCKYAHVRDLAQLPGVYTFCRNYQNSSCTYPHCRYVHATIFEEQRYYRTGNLPPHALSHHKKPNILPPPPPPPLPPPPPPPEGAKSCHGISADEELIRFRPSPNFKKMKKFLKSRGDYAESNNHSPSQGADQSPSTSASPEPLTTKEEQRELLEKAKSVQPPLPPVPPPVSPVNFNLPQKQEIETNDYESHGSTEESVQEQAPQFEPKPQNKTNTVSEPRPTMCRDFVRGTCSRGATCKYAHVRDLAQLPGVYTFCRNYQNSSCTYPHCRYVHATIFEEQRYYRTGNLPPHALSHHKKPNILPPPPPPPLPPPPPPPEEYPVEIPIFANSPPQVVPPSAPKPMISCVPTANLESRPVGFDFRINQQRDIGPKSPIKCKSCDTMEFRLQFNKDKTENLKRTTEELKSKVATLTSKTHSLYTAILGLMRPPSHKKPEGVMGLSSFLNMIGENEKNHLAANININLSNVLLKDNEQNLNAGARES